MTCRAGYNGATGRLPRYAPLWPPLISTIIGVLHRILDWLPLVVLLVIGLVAHGRAVILHRRGLRA